MIRIALLMRLLVLWIVLLGGLVRLRRVAAYLGYYHWSLSAPQLVLRLAFPAT